ncbi:hypothetical protein BDV93DRAFT_604359 [Ceratobasidium sp. AG-I]|nr:hypothetical protein BDV93DRAFT_604359 [Ceratobasidium sp. AG-I]
MFADPTMFISEYETKDFTPQYDILVPTQTEQINIYRTTKTLSDPRAIRPLGKRTNVWEVRRVENDEVEGPIYVLKDAWVRCDRVPEDSPSSRAIVDRKHQTWFSSGP